MSTKGQAIAFVDIIGRLESCIDEIKSTGELREWMSADGIAFLNDTLTRIQERKRTLERLINTPPHDVTSDFAEEELKSEAESYENLLFHLTETLKIARDRQGSLSTRKPLPSI